MDMRVKPDPMLLQALLTGAMLMQQIGNVRRCWELKSVACGVCAALRRRWEASSQISQDCPLQTQLSFLKCRVFNVSLTAINNQPSSPVDFGADSTLLKPDRPSHAILLILLEFAKVQEAFIREIRIPPTPGHPRQLRTDEIQEMKPKMMQIKKKMEMLRKGSSPTSDDFLGVNWMALEHIFHSMMTSITKLSAAQEDPEAYLECVVHARRALSSLKVIIDRVSRPSPGALKCTTALSWILPLYSLRPLYVIFSNVISKSDTLDLKLIQDVAEALRKLAVKERFASRVSHLFDSFVGLYDQFANRLIYADEDFYTQTTEAQKGTRLSPDEGNTACSQARVAGSQTTHNEENSDAGAEVGEFDQLTQRANYLDLPIFDPELFDQDVALELSFFDPILNPLDLDSFATGLFS